MMGNRILKESIKRSDQIDQLSWFEEVVYYRLLVTADDYGCLDGRITLLKNELFPTRDTVTKKSVEEAIRRLVNVGLLREYKVSDKPYLYFPTWKIHQTIRRPRHKYPEPSLDGQARTNDGQTPSLDGQARTNDGGCPSEYESNPNKNTNPNSNTKEKTPTHAHGEYGWVKLTDAQYANLVEKMGESELKRCITYLDQSAQSTGNKNCWKDWNLVVQRCHREGWGMKATKNNAPKPDTPEQRHQSAQSLKADMDWMDEFLSGGGGA